MYEAVENVNNLFEKSLGHERDGMRSCGKPRWVWRIGSESLEIKGQQP
jgi:hypothetical protein